jgi:hypothetical protein
MQRYFISVKKVILEVNGHDLGVLINFGHIRECLTVATLSSIFRRTFLGPLTTGFSILLCWFFWMVFWLGLVIEGRRLRLRRIMSSINEVINISMLISHSWLVRGESPFIIYYELILMNHPFHWHDKSKFIAIFLQRNSVFPQIEASNNANILSSEIPGKDTIHMIIL